MKTSNYNNRKQNHFLFFFCLILCSWVVSSNQILVHRLEDERSRFVQLPYQKSATRCQGLFPDLSRTRTLSRANEDQVLRGDNKDDHYSYSSRNNIVRENIILTPTYRTCGKTRQRLEHRIYNVPIYGSEAIITYEVCGDQRGYDNNKVVSTVRGNEFHSVRVPEGYTPTKTIQEFREAIYGIFGSKAEINGAIQVKVFVTNKGDFLAYFTNILRNSSDGLEAFHVIIDAHKLIVLSICDLVEPVDEEGIGINRQRDMMLRRRRQEEKEKTNQQEESSVFMNRRNLQCGFTCNATNSSNINKLDWTSSAQCDVNTLYLNDTGRKTSCKEGTLNKNIHVQGPGPNPLVFWNSICDCHGESENLTDACRCNAPFRDCADAGYDVQYAGEKTMEFLQTRLGFQGGLSVSAQETKWAAAYVHYGNKYCNAFCCAEPDDQADVMYLIFGDCQCFIGPMVSTDIVAHEIGHAVTRQSSALAYSQQSGGLNEGFSDILGTVLEFELNDSQDTPEFLIGEMINYIIRDMKDPASRFSIDNVCDYYDDMDVHHSSGVLNKAFVVAVEACETSKCDSLRNCVIGIGSMFLYANIHGLTALDGYVQAATATCELVDEFFAALPPSMSCTERQMSGFIQQGWSDVGIELDATCMVTVPGNCALVAEIPANDLCENAVTLQLGSSTEGTTRGATLLSSLNMDNNLCDLSTQAPGVWYSVTGTGNVLIASTCSPVTTYDTQISIFSGDDCVDATCIASNDDSCGMQSEVQWPSQAGKEYYILVHGYSNHVGDFELIVDDTEQPTYTWTEEPTMPPTKVSTMSGSFITLDVGKIVEFLKFSFDFLSHAFISAFDRPESIHH